MQSLLKKYIFPCCAILLLAYTSIRAYKLSFTIDESFTFIFYTLDTYKNIIRFTLLDPNNHVLNTMAMKFFTSLLPLSELTLRLQSLLAHASYLIFTWLLLRDFKNAWLRLLIWLVLNLNPFMLDFFSMARGYALSWGLLIASLYFLKEVLENEAKKIINIFICFLLAALSVLASFPLLNYYLALLVIFGCIALYKIFYKWNETKKDSDFWLAVIMVALISFPILKYTFNITFKLQHAGYLYFGGIVGFWTDTVGSVIERSLYGIAYPSLITILLKILVVVVPLTSIIFLWREIRIRKKPAKDYCFFTVLLALLFLISGSIIFSHIFLDARVVIQRAAIFILIIYLLMFANLLNYIGRKKIILPISILFAGASIFHFVYTANISYVFEWKTGSDAKQMMQDLEKIHTAENKSKVGKLLVFQPDWMYATTAMFYQYLYHYNWMEDVKAVKEYNFTDDYYYFPEDDLADLKGHPVEIVKKYPQSQSVLLKNLDKKVFKVFDKKDLNIESSTLNEQAFSPAIKFDVAALAGKPKISINAYAYASFPDGKCGDFIISTEDKSGKILAWKALAFDRYLLQSNGIIIIPYKIIMDKIDPDAAFIKVYIWNTGKKKIKLFHLSAEILYL